MKLVAQIAGGIILAPIIVGTVLAVLWLGLWMLSSDPFLS